MTEFQKIVLSIPNIAMKSQISASKASSHQKNKECNYLQTVTNF